MTHLIFNLLIKDIQAGKLHKQTFNIYLHGFIYKNYTKIIKL